MDDEMLMAMKTNGGVVQMVALSAYVKADPPERGTAITALRQEFGVAPGRGAGAGRAGGAGRGAGRGTATQTQVSVSGRGQQRPNFLSHFAAKLSVA